MCNRTGQFNMAHALATNFCQRDFNATLFTDDATMLHALVLAAQTLIVFDWAKNLGTEKTFTLWLEGTVVNGFGFLTSPNDQERIISGDARPIRIVSNSVFCSCCLSRLTKSFKAFPPVTGFAEAIVAPASVSNTALIRFPTPC